MNKRILSLFFLVLVLSCSKEEKKDNSEFAMFIWETDKVYNYRIMYNNSAVGIFSFKILSEVSEAPNDMVYESVTTIQGIKDIRRIFFNPSVSYPPLHSTCNISNQGKRVVNAEAYYLEDKVRINLQLGDNFGKIRKQDIILDKNRIIIDKGSIPFMARYWKGKKKKLTIILPESLIKIDGELLEVDSNMKLTVRNKDYEVRKIELKTDLTKWTFYVEESSPYRLISFTISGDNQDFEYEFMEEKEEKDAL